MQVVKASGEIQDFDVSKLISSIRNALELVGAADPEYWAGVLAKTAAEKLHGKDTVYTWEIRDAVGLAFKDHLPDEPSLEDAASAYELYWIYKQVYGDQLNEAILGLVAMEARRWSYNAVKVLEARYLRRDPETWRFIETPDMMLDRVALHIASVTKDYEGDARFQEDYENFYRIMANGEFLPNSPTLMNAGTRLGILSACFVIPVRDSMTTPDGEGIMDALRAQAITHQHAGGTGFSFSELRPEGDIVSSSGGVSSGPLSFMRLFDLTTDVVKQGGKRRGANMGIMHVWHADIEKFIVAKTGELKDVHLQNFNISVGFNDDFMYRVANDMEWYLINPRKTDLTGRRDSRQYAIVRARHYMSEDWVQEVILDELERNGGSIALEDSVLVTMNEALAIAKHEGAVVKTVRARELFGKIVESAWDSGDPGFINFDEINRRHPVWYLGEISATNPCVSGDSYVMTPSGLVKAKELYENGVPTHVLYDENVLGEGGDPFGRATRLVTLGTKIELTRTVHGRSLRLHLPKRTDAIVWRIGRKKGVKVYTKEGYEITVTKEHKFRTIDGEWVNAENLKPGMKLELGRIATTRLEQVFPEGVELDGDIAYMLGWLLGDGTASKHFVGFYFAKHETASLERVRRALWKLTGTWYTVSDKGSMYVIRLNPGTKGYKKVIELLGGLLDRQTERVIPENLLRLNGRSLANMLSGLFTADGTVDNDKAIRLASSSLEMLKQVQLLLLAFGIQSRIYKNRRRDFTPRFKYISASGEERMYTPGAYHELVINGYSRLLFMHMIGFGEPSKNDKVAVHKLKIDPVYATVEKIEEVEDEFYDFMVPDTHIYIANGLVNHNCGEEPLLPWEPCNLGSINLEKFIVNDPSGPVIDVERLERVIRIAVRFLDNVIDRNMHPIRQIREANLRTRKIGLGVMGLARLLARLGIRYDSPEGVALSWALADFISRVAYDESIRLAGIRGTFPAFDPERYRPIWETMPYSSLGAFAVQVMQEFGIDFEVRFDNDVFRSNFMTLMRSGPTWVDIVSRYRRNGIRNATVLSIAPTGTISILAGASPSIEPFFALAFIRKVAIGEFIEYDQLFLRELANLDGDTKRYVLETGHLPEDHPLNRVYRTAHEMGFEWHILHQAVWQNFVDAGTSKTINMRSDEPVESVWRAYWMAWRLHLKGVTVYRDKSKSTQVINTGVKKPGNGREPKPAPEPPGNGKRRGLRLGRGKVKTIVEGFASDPADCPTCDV